MSSRPRNILASSSLGASLWGQLQGAIADQTDLITYLGENYWKTAENTVLTANLNVTGDTAFARTLAFGTPSVPFNAVSFTSQFSTSFNNRHADGTLAGYFQISAPSPTQRTMDFWVSDTGGDGSVIIRRGNNKQYFTINGDGMIIRDSVNLQGLVYYADYSAAFTDRSLIDRGFANSNYWKTGDFTTLSDTDNTIIDVGNETGFSLRMQAGDSLINNVLFNLYAEATGNPTATISSTGSAGNKGALLAQEGRVEIQAYNAGEGNVFNFLLDGTNNTAVFNDLRVTPVGIVYGGDYSAGFTDRSLIDRGFANSNYWKTEDTTTITDATIINVGNSALSFNATGTGSIHLGYSSFTNMIDVNNTIAWLRSSNVFNDNAYIRTTQAGFDSGLGLSLLVMDGNTFNTINFDIGKTGARFTDDINGKGIEYGASGYEDVGTDLVLVTKGWTSTNYWKTSGITVVTGLPTDCTGQETGTIWNDSGTLKICP